MVNAMNSKESRRNILPDSHILPVNPRTHEQRNLLTRFVHLPLFKHGELLHSSISEAIHARTIHIVYV